MIRIGTRGSELALWQANFVARSLGRESTVIVVIKTSGDRIRDISFDKMEGKGFFTKEIEEALLKEEVDLAVHSMKDLPTEETPGLRIAAVMRREDPSDVLLVRNDKYTGEGFPPIAEGSVVGTSSLRRAAQIRNVNRSVRVEPLRGNVTTRVRRLQEGKFDAIILARAGLLRLGINLSGCTPVVLPFSFFLPAPAQGALALQIRSADEVLSRAVDKLNDPETGKAVSAERAFLKHFGGGCHVPLGALASTDGDGIHLSGVVASVNGEKLIRGAVTGKDPETTGEMLALQLKDEGAEGLL